MLHHLVSGDLEDLDLDYIHGGKMDTREPEISNDPAGHRWLNLNFGE